MASRTSSQSGNWNDSATWNNLSVPGDGDDATIAADHVVTVTANQTVGASGTDGSVALTLIGHLVINSSITMTFKGDISQQRTSTVRINAGVSLIFSPPNAGTYKWITPDTGSGTPKIDIFGSSGSRVSLTTSLAAGGNRGYFDWTAYPPTLGWSYLDITEWGGTGDTTATRAGSYTAVEGSYVVWDHVRSLGGNVGMWQWNFSSFASFTWRIKDCDFRGGRNTTLMYVTGFVGNSGGERLFQGNTAYNTTAQNFVFYLLDTVICDNIFVNVRCIGDVQSSNQQLLRNAVIFDVSPNGFMVGAADANNVIAENVFLADQPSKADNPHYLVFTGSQAGAPLHCRDNVIDGFGVVGSDSGDFLVQDGIAHLYRNLLINKAGTLFTATYTGAQYYAYRNTLHNSMGATMGEGAGAATLCRQFTSNLIVSQGDGIHQEAFFVTQTNLDLDYNGFFNMLTPGNLDLAGQNSYLGAETITTWRSGTYGTTDNYGLHDIYGDPKFVNVQATAVTWYDSVFGSGGSFANVRAELIKKNGTDLAGSNASFTAGATVRALWSYLRKAFTPTATIYRGAADPQDGYADTGALEILSVRGRILIGV